MGKKSRRKKGAKNKDVGVDREPLNSGQNNEQIFDPNEAASPQSSPPSRSKRPFFVGDRVWFIGNEDIANWDRDNPNTYRGFVGGVGDDEVDIITLQAKIDDTNDYYIEIGVAVNVEFVFPDVSDMTLRFDVGDRVLINTATIDSPNWISSTVDRIWPIELRHDYTNIKAADNNVVHYLCGTYLIPSDHNAIIVEHPASFRFKIGDNVTINSSKAIQWVKKAKDDVMPHNWFNAVVIGVDVTLVEKGNQTDQPKMYVVYACSFEINGKSRQCYIAKDDDEHITGADSIPRERLFEAIDQDCSFEHLSYLTSFYSIDISLFREMVIDRAVASASFNTLLWLQECHSLSMDEIKDEHGNNLMHQIATSDKATHFIKEVAQRYKFGKEHGRVLDVFNRYSMGRPTSSETNRNGETWLNMLVKNGYVNAVDAALSPKTGFAWWMTSMYALDAESTQSLSECVESIGDVLITAIFEQFLSLRKWKTLYDSLHDKLSSKAESQEKDELTILQGSSGKRNAEKFIRFWQDWSGDEMGRNPFLVMVEKGYSDLFRLFFEANKDFFVNSLYRVYPKCDQREFIQPEMSTHHSKFPRLNESADIVSIAMIGSAGHVPHGWTSDEYIETKKKYFCQLFAHVENCKTAHCASWLAHLKLKRIRFDSTNDMLEQLVKYKVSLLEDDDALIGRMEILKYLLYDTTVIAKYSNIIDRQPPKDVITMNIMTTIRFRQCGVLKWMTEVLHLVHLDEAVSMERDYIKNYVDKFHFTANSSMLLGHYFCLAAVEFDDLYSLQWLVTKVGCPVVSFDGFNLLHLSAYLGRIEIIAWLHTTDVWESLVDEVSTRQSYDNCTAVYVAAGEGHLLVVELLIRFGCEVNERTLIEHARKSGQAFVLKWVDNRERLSQPSALELDVMKLLELLAAKDSSLEDLKKYIIDTKCLSIKSWNGISCYKYDCLSSFEMSFGDVINICCKHGDCEFVVWLCIRISFWDEKYSYERFWDREYSYESLSDRLRMKLLDHDDLTTLCKEMGLDKLTQILSKKWTKNVRCSDPSTLNLFSLSALEDDKILSSSVHSKLLYAKVLIQLSDKVRQQINYMLRHGGSCEDISELLHDNEKIRSCLKEEGYFLKDFQLNGNINTIAKNEVLDFESYSYMKTYTDVKGSGDHPLRRTNFVFDRQLGDLSHNIHIVLATEGYTELIHFCRKNFRGWTADAELEAAYVAAYFGQDEIVGMFLCSSGDVNPPLLSDINERFAMILLGAAESGRYQDLTCFISLREPPFDPIKEVKHGYANLKDMAQKSLAVAIFCGILRKAPCDNDDKFVSEMFNLLECDLSYSVKDIFHSMEVALQLVKYDIKEGECIERFIELFRLAGTKFATEPVIYHQQMQSFTKLVVGFVFDRMRNMSDDKKEAFKFLVLSWIEDLVSAGIDVQDLQPRYMVAVEVKDFLDSLGSLQKKQRGYWAQFDVIKKQHKHVFEIQSEIENGFMDINGRGKGGSTLLHLAAAYNRADLLEWLVVTKGMDINSLDGSGRTPLQCSLASNAVDTVGWISVYMAKQTIQSFVFRNYKRVLMQRKQQGIKNAAMTIQKVARGRLTRKLYRGPLLLRLGESQQFNEIWMDVINKVPETCDSLSGWSLVREELDGKRRVQLLDDYGNLSNLDERLGQAVTGALNGNNEMTGEYEKEDTDFNTDFKDDLSFDKEECTIINKCIDWTQFQMTSHVVKFIKHGDPKYREIFVKRLKQLAKGERSHKLQKPLKGCDSIIFETYLEQKSGFRILWTQSDTDGGNIIIWFVAKHKSVSRLAKLIDDAKGRSHSRQVPEDILSREEIEDGNLKSQPVLIDPLGNVPLKLYDVQFQCIDDIATNTWTPQMHLTEEECEVVKAKGTVLLLGRSGTGKTVCIMNRMEFDRHCSGLDPSFSQLFVSRSNRLCRYVEGAVGSNDRTTFSTFDKLLYRLEVALLSSGNNVMSFLPSRRVSFSRFRREFFDGLNQRNLPDALIVWKNVKTYLRGSLEAHKSPGQVLSKSDFTSGILGKNRCRLSPNLRECVYDLFLKYEQYKQAGQLWDDCDRVCYILKRLDEVKRVDPLVFDEFRESKIYVDEVQDYTQIEVLLFFYLSGPGGLFLAGDPAQSVDEGTDFRFEDIRSVGYYIAGEGSSSRRDLVPSKPLKVNVNYRSHRGILNTASSILDFLFATFPSAANLLEKDDGLFGGSRPGFNYNVDIKQLSNLLSGKLNGTVILTADESASHWKRALNYELVIGVRAAKGLEFKSVIILDFFGELPFSIHKAWRDLLLNRADLTFERDYPLVETYLKLLYVAVTRCIERLLFVETSSSIAGDAAIRWLCKKDGALATQNNVMDVEGMTLTADEFVSQGLDYIQTAESTEIEFDEAMTQIRRAIYCFEQAQASQLTSKARLHRLSIQFRSDLSHMSMPTHQESTSAASKMVIEAKGAQLISLLLSENLLEECKSLIQAVSPFVSAYAEAEIDRRITRNIQQ